MKQRKPKIIYDKESQVLSWELSPKKSVDSDVQGNVVIDYDSKGKIVRINFYDFDFENFKSQKHNLAKFTQNKVFVKV